MGDTDCGFDDRETGATSGVDAVLQVEGGRATDAELAAVTVVLFSLLAVRGEDTGEGLIPDVPQWRAEQAPDAYRSPYSWR
jgi:hypothetical protein